jgi:hypothetical protein
LLSKRPSTWGTKPLQSPHIGRTWVLMAETMKTVVFLYTTARGVADKLCLWRWFINIIIEVSDIASQGQYFEGDHSDIQQWGM